MKYVIALALSIFAAQSHADSWAPAKVAGLASPTGEVVVRVVPGRNLDATYGFSGAQKGDAAIATFYRLHSSGNYVKYREISLLNPVAPIFSAVSDSGGLVTLDNWHNMGAGNAVVAVYAPGGKVLRSYSLADIYTEAEVKMFDHSASSIWWRCPSQPVFEPRESVLVFMDTLGANVEVSLKTGAVTRNVTVQKSC